MNHIKHYQIAFKLQLITVMIKVKQAFKSPSPRQGFATRSDGCRGPGYKDVGNELGWVTSLYSG